jgi:hypothetical protein
MRAGEIAGCVARVRGSARQRDRAIAGACLVDPRRGGRAGAAHAHARHRPGEHERSVARNVARQPGERAARADRARVLRDRDRHPDQARPAVRRDRPSPGEVRTRSGTAGIARARHRSVIVAGAGARRCQRQRQQACAMAARHQRSDLSRSIRPIRRNAPCRGKTGPPALARWIERAEGSNRCSCGRRAAAAHRVRATAPIPMAATKRRGAGSGALERSATSLRGPSRGSYPHGYGKRRSQRGQGRIRPQTKNKRPGRSLRTKTRDGRLSRSPIKHVRQCR